MNAEKRRIPKWIWWSLVALGGVSIVLIIISIHVLPSSERTAINIITIIGSVLGVTGIALAIYQQIQLISVSAAIEKTTSDIENKIINIHYEINIINSIKWLDGIENYLATDTDINRVQLRLDDLHNCIMDCRKILEKNGDIDNANYSRFCLADKKIIRFKTLILSAGSLSKLKTKNFSNFVVNLKRDLNQMKKIPYFV